MRIAFAGLATSHPFTDANVLEGSAELVAWEDDAERRSRFTAEHASARLTPSLTALLETEPDGVVVTVPTPAVNDVLEQVLEAGVAVFVNKPAAATRQQLARLDKLVSPVASRVLSSSVLRFAPEYQDFARNRMPALDDVLAVRATVRHDVGLWAGGYNRWQDEPAEGGGSLVTMGLHGVELLVAMLGPDVECAGAVGSVRKHHGLHSEDVGALTLRWASGIAGSVEVIGVTDPESYAVAVHTQRHTVEFSIEPGGDPIDRLGYAATSRAFLNMVNGAESPAPWEQTRAALNVVISARESALT